MAEQTEKAFLKQPNVFLCSKKSGKGKTPGKGGNRYWSIGLGFKTPHVAIEGTYINQKCPFTYINQKCPFSGNVSIRRRIIAGTCYSAKMFLMENGGVRRYEKQHSNIPAHISPCFRVKEGDHVLIGQCRLMSKTVSLTFFR